MLSGLLKNQIAVQKCFEISKNEDTDRFLSYVRQVIEQGEMKSEHPDSNSSIEQRYV